MAAKIRHISDEMLVVASEVLAKASPALVRQNGPLLPDLAEIGTLSKDIAFAVAKMAQEQGLAATMSDEDLWTAIEQQFWLPEYRDYKHANV